MSNLPVDPERGAWIFVSHSNRDLVKVRQVRNELEDLGHKPILFYLKAQEDDRWPKIFPVIKAEIRSREWFVLCDSANARKSPAVIDEVAYIEKIKTRLNKTVATVDIENDWDQSRNRLGTRAATRLHALSKSASVLLVHSRSNSAAASTIADALSRSGYRVWDPLDLPAGTDFASEVRDALESCHVIALLDPDSTRSGFVKHELGLAVESALGDPKRSLVAVILSDFQQTLAALQRELPALATLNALDLSSKSIEAGVDQLVRILRSHQF